MTDGIAVSPFEMPMLRKVEPVGPLPVCRFQIEKLSINIYNSNFRVDV